MGKGTGNEATKLRCCSKAGDKAAEDRKVRLLEEMQAQGKRERAKGEKGMQLNTDAKGVQRQQRDQRIWKRGELMK